MIVELEKPSIAVCVKEPDTLILREVLAGIEEEGLPYSLGKFEGEDMMEGAYDAAYQSRMGVAVGIAENRVILHYSKLQKDIPVLDISLKPYERLKSRRAGNNAARLYKVMPFKDMEDAKEIALIESIKAKVIAALNSRINRRDVNE